MAVLADFFGAIMAPCYVLTHNWWAAIALFTLITKVLLLPVSLWTQKNSVLMVSLLPEVNRIKIDHFGDKEAIGELQTALNKEHGYHPLLSLLPLALQILILFGLVDVIRGIVASGAPGTEFMGMVPLENGGISWIMPVLAALSSLVLGLAQNHINPLQREQGRAEKASTNGLSIALSAVLGVSVAAGMVFYWICSNLMAIAVQLLCNAIYKPAKHVDYPKLRESQKELAALEALDKGDRPWWKPNPLASRERADVARFNGVVGKHLVFYSERSGFYKYFQGAIEWLLKNSDIRIHYITNDANDQVFELHKDNPRLIPYYVGEKRLITLMMKMDCDVFVATLADLDNYYLKRSYVRKDIEYVFMFHHLTSTFLVGSADCHDHYDTLLCAGPHQLKETRREEEVRHLPAKNLVPVGYDLLDRERAEMAKRPPKQQGSRPVALVAPSWQEDCILDLCPDATIRPLLDAGFSVIVRPHPEYTKRYAARWAALQERFQDVPKDSIRFEHDFSSQDSIFDADVLVTDWSSISCEFSFATGRPTIFVDTPMKEGNDQWRELGLEPTDITLRNQIGKSLTVDELAQIGNVARSMIDTKDIWAARIEDIYAGFIYNPGHGGEAAGRYLLEAVLKKQKQKEQAKEASRKSSAQSAPKDKAAKPRHMRTEDHE